MNVSSSYDGAVARASATPRRTQRERSATTRAALLDAALSCLVDHGYAGTTTGLVCARAGVSRGAHLHHFGTRQALVAAALAELARRREAEFAVQVEGLPDGPERIERALELLWSWFTEPLFYASVDIGVAARTDPELRETLLPLERHLNMTTLERCRIMFAGDAAEGARDQEIQLTLAVIRGLALLPILQPGTTHAAQQWELARPRLLEAFAAAK
jgi:AcrR family transcriptional regulator